MDAPLYVCVTVSNYSVYGMIYHTHHSNMYSLMFVQTAVFIECTEIWMLSRICVLILCLLNVLLHTVWEYARCLLSVFFANIKKKLQTNKVNVKLYMN
jgi:hypothetical protein